MNSPYCNVVLMVFITSSNSCQGGLISIPHIMPQKKLYLYYFSYFTWKVFLMLFLFTAIHLTTDFTSV